MERPLRSQFWGGKAVEHGRQFFEPAISHVRIADVIGMRAVVRHGGRIESGILVDQHDR
jgi:hypothetical protein